VDCPGGRECHPLGRRQWSDAIFSGVHRVFDAQLSVLSLKGLHTPKRVTDSRVELEHKQLHRDDSNQSEGE
jgi:hypothetical protein